MANGNEKPVENPTYLGHIRHFFDEDPDIDHMRELGIDLATYEGVKFNALRVYVRTNEGTMPPSSDRRWSKARVQTFYNWLKHGCPRGVAEPVPIPKPSPVERTRRNLADVKGPELQMLKKAFRELINRDDDDRQSYFALAGIHWLPGPHLYCRHHENAYNPWHRAYLLRFEDALRSVAGCEDVTLPYWDITANTIPQVLYEKPFATYVIPRQLCTLDGFCYAKDSVTERFSAEDILKNITLRGISENISDAEGHSHWERFNGWDAGRTQDGLIRAHDNGHVACGPTLENQDVAAFDPMFWFFHTNWDRLWWKWQQHYGATTLSGFRTHLAGSSEWLDDPALNGLAPFDLTSAQTIDSRQLGVEYSHPIDEAPASLSALRFGNRLAASPFSIRATKKASVRVKNIDRLQIPGSFDIVLHVGDKAVGKQAFFQSTTPKHCASCRKNALVSVDFVVDQHELQDGSVRVTIEILRETKFGRQFPLSACGNPSVNVRLLLEN